MRIEFERVFINSVTKFPEIEDMKKILDKCRKFWNNQNNVKTLQYINVLSGGDVGHI